MNTNTSRLRGDTTKLPVWAQDRIKALENAVVAIQGEIDQMTNKVESPIAYQVGMGDLYHLPESASVRFVVGKEIIVCSLKPERDRTVLVVGALTRKLIIEPTSSNRIVITAEME